MAGKRRRDSRGAQQPPVSREEKLTERYLDTKRRGISMQREQSVLPSGPEGSRKIKGKINHWENRNDGVLPEGRVRVGQVLAGKDH